MTHPQIIPSHPLDYGTSLSPYLSLVHTWGDLILIKDSYERKEVLSYGKYNEEVTMNEVGPWTNEDLSCYQLPGMLYSSCYKYLNQKAFFVNGLDHLDVLDEDVSLSPSFDVPGNPKSQFCLYLSY